MGNAFQGGGHIVVPEQLLDGADAGAALKQVGGEGMTKGMGADVLCQTDAANRHLDGLTVVKQSLSPWPERTVSGFIWSSMSLTLCRAASMMRSPLLQRSLAATWAVPPMSEITAATSSRVVTTGTMKLRGKFRVPKDLA
jgi:hypothetical protein